MVDQASTDGDAPLSTHAERALAALLAIDASDAAAVRECSPTRRRPQRQHGPLLDLGDPDPSLDDG